MAAVNDDTEAEVYSRRFRHPTISGDTPVEIDGAIYYLPASAELQIVKAARGREFAHVRHEGRVTILTREGEVERSEEAAAFDAMDVHWNRLKRLQ